MLRGPASMRTQGAVRLRDRASKEIMSRADAVNSAEDSMAYPELTWGKRFAGAQERGMQARVAQEAGRSYFLHPEQATLGTLMKCSSRYKVSSIIQVCGGPGWRCLDYLG